MQSMSGRLFNAYDEKTKAWGQIYEDESAEGRALLRRRTAYYKARKDLTEYIEALERTIIEAEFKHEVLEETVRDQHIEIADRTSTIRQLQADLQKLNEDNMRLSKEIEQRNRTAEAGPDEIGREYIRRLGIPELTEVFERVVLGQ
jgi:septal ring factor EnvC (AmiA/AmiB activator)